MADRLSLWRFEKLLGHRRAPLQRKGQSARVLSMSRLRTSYLASGRIRRRLIGNEPRIARIANMERSGTVVPSTEVPSN